MTAIRTCTGRDFTTTRWSGGTTMELLLLPPGSDYAQRRFAVRLSSAVVEVEQSSFTHLPGVRRWIAPLEHPLVLRHETGPEIRLHPYEVYAFDGGRETRSRGTGRDFNLMLQGPAQGSMAVLWPGREERLVAQEASLVWVFYAGSESHLLIDRELHILQRMELVTAELTAGERITLAAVPGRDRTPLLYGLVTGMDDPQLSYAGVAG